MMADHGDPCTGSEEFYCMNGGKCFKIPSVSTPTCVCGDNFKGSRCEQFQLLSISPNSEEKGMIAAVIIILILIMIMLAVVIYYICKIKKRSAENKRKQQKNNKGYWNVQSKATLTEP
ncbi:pro-neuregulin-4, membrane-bound isoform [Astyanax mexicanus]|uniref:Neuregulin 4 n=1 Tax=Astyanax mexicanus TaxID=7994 RepID=A0A3B1K875_ASTMX|nr:pro-neuregulin-4, membrane-bound isoform [Astyanax mexicanus]